MQIIFKNKDEYTYYFGKNKEDLLSPFSRGLGGVACHPSHFPNCLNIADKIDIFFLSKITQNDSKKFRQTYTNRTAQVMSSAVRGIIVYLSKLSLSLHHLRDDNDTIATEKHFHLMPMKSERGRILAR